MLIKFFEKEAHANDFINGNLFCRKVKEFEAIESKEKHFLRQDKFEGVHSIINSIKNGTIQVIENKNVTFEMEVEFTSPITLRNKYDSSCPIYCMFSLSAELLSQSMVDFNKKEIYLFDERLKNFGEYAVIVSDYKRFFDRLEMFSKKHKMDVTANHVTYHDEKKHNGIWGFFRKPLEYKYQSEFRVVFHKPINRNTISYNIGSLSSFTKKIKVSELDTFAFKEHGSEEFLRITWK